MKLFLLLAGLAVAGAMVPSAGYKPYAKYVYNYTADLEVALGNERDQWTGMKINASVEFHFLPNNKVLLVIPKTSLWEVVLDPKYSFAPNMTVCPHTSVVSERLSIPIQFGYSNGLVNLIYSRADDPLWSVNMKKSIINLLHVDMMGKDEETGEKSLFTKPETSIYGICNTTYAMRDYSVFQVDRMAKVGMNITKLIDTSNCTMGPTDKSSTVGVGPIGIKEENPLKTSTVIKYNVIGNEIRFKLQQVNATGRFVFVPFTEVEGSVIAATSQILTLITEGVSTMSKVRLDLPVSSTLITPVETPVMFPRKASYNAGLIVMVQDIVMRLTETFKGDISMETPLEVNTPEIFLRLVNLLRVAEKEVLDSVWSHCGTEEESKRWFLYGLSLTGNETCLKFIENKMEMEKIPTHLLAEFIHNLGFVSKPSLPWLKAVKHLCSLEIVKKDKYLNQTCLVVISNAVKSYCEVFKHCTAETDQDSPSILSYLEFITTPCVPTPTTTCWNEVDIMPVLVAAENLGFVSYWPLLKKIITDPKYPLAIRAKAITACRQIILRNPTHVRVAMFRIYRDVKEEVELRALAFDVLMVNPTTSIIKICASSLYLEPSNEIKSFVISKINAILTLNPTMVGKDIYAACVISKKFYLTDFPRLFAKSKHVYYKLMEFFYSRLQVLGYKTVLYTNATFLPRYIRSGMNITLFGRNFNLFDSEVRIEGLQEFLSKLSMPNIHRQEKKSMWSFMESEKTEVEENEELKEINRKIPVRPQYDETLKLFTSMKLFNKVFYFNYTVLNTTVDWKELLFKDVLFRAAALETELKEGKVFKFTKPLIPVEVVYTIPTHVGWPLTLNATVITITKMHSEIKAEVKPSLFSPRSIWTKERESFEAHLINNVTTVWQTLASMYFKVPFVEVGVRLNKTMNMTKCTRSSVSYDFKTQEYKVDYALPQMDTALMWQKTELYNYIRPEPMHNTDSSVYAIRKHNITVDRNNAFRVINGSFVFNATSRHARWALQMDTSEYLCVGNSVVTTCKTPYYFDVIFHGPHRRLVSLYAPGKGYITMSHRSICLQLKRTITKDYAKLFVIDYIHPFEIQLKTLVRMPKESMPVSWDVPNVADYYTLKEVEELYMREHVALENEDHVEEQISPENLAVRVVYLKVVAAKKVCVTPRHVAASHFRIIVNKTFEDVIRNISLSTGYCSGASWGIRFCVHGYYPKTMGTPFLQQLISPMEFSVWMRRNTTNAPKTISTVIKVLEKKYSSTKYRMEVKLVGTIPERNIVSEIHITRSMSEKKFSVIVDPSQEELLSFKKFCFTAVSKGDYFRLVASMHPQCLVPHLKMDVVSSPVLPRHYMTFRFNYTYESLPITWQRIFNNVSTVFHASMKMQSTYFYVNNNTNITGFNSTHFTVYLTSPRTLDFITRTDRYTYETKEIVLPYARNSFPKGSNVRHLYTKLSRDLMAPRCQHKNSTFTTFDDVTYNYNLSSGCDHILLRNCSRNVTNFVVLVKRHPVDYRMRVVTILVDTYKIELIPTNTTAPPTIKINGEVITLVNNFHMVEAKDKKMPVILLKYEHEFHNLVFQYLNGLDLFVEIREGWKILTRVSPLLVGKTCGLCGDYDMEQTEEFKTPERQTVSDPRLFGFGWIVPGEKCSSGCTFKTDFLEVKEKPIKAMTCLLKHRLPYCLPTCKPTETRIIRLPKVCVPVSYVETLKNHLIYGRPITKLPAKEFMAEVEYPVSCSCPCDKNFRAISQKSITGYEEYFMNMMDYF